MVGVSLMRPFQGQGRCHPLRLRTGRDRPPARRYPTGLLPESRQVRSNPSRAPRSARRRGCFSGRQGSSAKTASDFQIHCKGPAQFPTRIVFSANHPPTAIPAAPVSDQLLVIVQPDILTDPEATTPAPSWSVSPQPASPSSRDRHRCPLLRRDGQRGFQ